MPRPGAALREAVYPLAFPVKDSIARRFVPDDAARLERVRRALVRDYFCDFPTGYLDTDTGRVDLANHLRGRREVARRRVLPWLDSLRPLDGARVLEIGCGTGSSTFAFAEQGASVCGLELEARHLSVARERLATAGLDADLRVANVTQAASLFARAQFDLVVFYGSLEHMTLEERLEGLALTFELVREEGLLCIVDAPNRLWHFDRHTSRLPFFDWLPDELAYRYAARSPRPVFREAFGAHGGGTHLEFLRWGRGVSYHEVELALGVRIEELQVEPSQLAHDHRRNPVLGAAFAASRDGRYRRMLASFAPHVPPAFFEPQLNLAIRKRALRHAR